MSDSNKSFRWHMHEESADKFNPGNGALFPLPFFTVIFHIVGNGIVVHANNTVIADSNSMCIFSLIGIGGYFSFREIRKTPFWSSCNFFI